MLQVADHECLENDKNFILHDYLIMTMDFLQSKGVSVDRLRTFCLVVETGSVIEAAEGDPNRQSQFSRQIGELEAGLGIKLFERINRRLVPTEIGRELALMTRSYFEGIQELRKASQQSIASLTIIGGEGVLAWLVYPRLAQMLDAFDKVSFSFRQSSTMDSVRSVRTGKADIALIRSNALTQDLLHVPLGIMKYRVVVLRRLLPGKFAASFDLLRSLPTAVLRGSGNFVRSLHEVARSAGFELIVAAEADSFVALRALVESEAVAAVLPEGLVDTFSLERFARISAKELDSLRREIVVTCNVRSASLRPAIHQATQQLASLWAP